MLPVSRGRTQNTVTSEPRKEALGRYIRNSEYLLCGKTGNGHQTE
jgi:hypothetical protein